jgi:hypothetical protein
MRKLGLIGGTAAVLLAATAVMAASPSPSTAPSIAPSASPSTAPSASPSASPAASASGTPSAKTTSGGWSATVAPATLSGTASIAKGANGSATLTMHMQGVLPWAPLTITVARAGTPTRPVAESAVLVRWSDRDIDRLGNDTLRVHLTAAEYRSLAAARSKAGFVIVVQDGSLEALETFPKA